VRSTRCPNNPRSAAGADEVQRIADYAAGYAEALADRADEAESVDS
jgi:hypothetical protein